MRIAKRTDPRRLAALKIKVHNEHYLNRAIDKIALVLTNNLLRD